MATRAAVKTKPFSVFLRSLQASGPSLCAGSQAAGGWKPYQQCKEERVTLCSRWASKHRQSSRYPEQQGSLHLYPCSGAWFLRLTGRPTLIYTYGKPSLQSSQLFWTENFWEKHGFSSLPQLSTMLRTHCKLKCQIQRFFFLFVWYRLP